MEKKEIIIDATGKPLGRLASQIAVLLQDKHLPNYEPRLEGETTVKVINASKIVFTGKKLNQKIYYRHTQGYVGHIKEIKLKEIFPKKVDWIIKEAVKGMLPKNKLRKRRLKRLIIEP